MVPGPTHCEQEPTWQLGAINPSGLSGKGSTCKQLGHGIFAVSETQLSSRGIPRFRRELEAVGSKFHYVPGWKELQSWAEDELGIPPGPTCKYRTRKDFVFLSPSLQQLIKSVSNEFDMFADHSVLQASLAFFSAPAPVPRWRKPKPLQLDKATQVKIRDMSCPMPALPTDPTSQYQMACKMFEQHVDHALSQQGLSPLLDMQKGRACTMQREMVQPNLVQVKPSRHGEVSPGISDWSLGYKRWFTQLRRLVSLSNAMQEPGPSPGRLDYQLAVWGAVKRASGFTPTFVRWWNEQQYKHEGWPHLTGALPSPQSAMQMVKCFQSKVEQWEQVLKQQQAAKARTRRAEHPNIVFQDVRRPRPVPVQTVVSKSTAQITEVVDEASVIFTSQDAFNSIQPLEARTGILPIIHLEEEQVWFQVPHGLSVGDTLVQVEPHGSLDAVHEAFMVEWSRRWDRHRHVPSDHDRAALRATQRKPIHAIRDLGGHLQFTGQQGNATIAKRLKDLDDLWPKLAASAASKSQKLRVVRTVCSLLVRLPAGGRLQRRFDRTMLVQEVLNWVESDDALLEEVRLLRAELRQLTVRVDSQADQIVELRQFQEASALSSVAAVTVQPDSSQASIPASVVASEIDIFDPSTLERPEGPTPYPWSEREQVARDIGCFLAKCLAGENRGSSGRSRLQRLPSQVYVVVKEVSGAVHRRPALIFTKFSDVRACCQSGSYWGDSAFVGLPSVYEARIAVQVSGCHWPRKEEQ
eukprot:Skav206086  [mRNA]  locus=scaffold2150:94795:105168:+ [translate_table: standard]